MPLPVRIDRLVEPVWRTVHRTAGIRRGSLLREVSPNPLAVILTNAPQSAAYDKRS